MAKSKNKSRFTSDQVHKKNKHIGTTKLKSPFEVHINNEKLKVLGRKNKHNKGLPGVSRAKAIDKRKKTLLQEYKIQNKSNVFTDRRIGEYNQALSSEEKQMARFAAIRVKSHKKKSIFNLGEDEILTHRGQTLSEIEKFDDPKSEDEDFEDDDVSGKLDKQFVEEAHFGGGVLKKTGIEGAKSHKDLIEQLIFESKKRKAEKQKIKEATLELTEKLDTEWKDLLPLVSKSKKKPEDEPVKPKLEDYDKVMRELKFESRGTVSDRLKSEEEIAKEEKEKLEKLETERLQRMKGITEENSIKHTHRSADDLDDDFVYENEDEVTLSYDKDGQSNFPLNDNVEEKEEEVPQDSEESESEIETDSEDDLSDLKAESSSSEEEEEKQDEAVITKNGLNQHKDIKDDLLKRKDVMDKARNELPYTFSLPKNYEELNSMLIKHSYVHQGIIIERMIKCNHSSLAEGNKDSLGLLFAYLLQYINDIAAESDDEESIKIVFIFLNR
ncbi:hypothetical protein HHI36_007172 [Cryptolaemus montrouzieri]|uniref:Nucleolar protein 14 n=1 Tax=Cryptolaemus montrouzieri TaxID=559131 RepID=A0ABD2MNV0_9CUCU